jgi:hypothetical protein
MAAMGVEELEASGARCRRPTFTAPRPCRCVLSHGPKIHQSASNLTARICAMSMADASNLSIGSTYIHNGCCLVRWYRLLSGLLLPITFQVVMLESVMDRCQSRHELVHRRLLVRDRCCRRWLVDEEADFWDCWLTRRLISGIACAIVLCFVLITHRSGHIRRFCLHGHVVYSL